MITADQLKQIKLFAPVPESERKTIAASAADLHLDPGEWLLMEGQAPAFYGLLEGKIDVYKWVGGRELKLISYSPGDYFGEVPLMLGAPSLASLRAAEHSRVVRLEPSDFMRLVSHCRTLNGEISRTMMDRISRLNQVTVDNPALSTRVIGHRLDSTCYEIREFLTRNRIPFEWNGDEVTTGSDGAFPPPVVELADGSRLESPSRLELARALDLNTKPKLDAYDVVIVGGGPAGLAAAVYGASEGLCTLLVDRMACGGQAGMSSRIENYLGFPAGLGGDELASRACQQAGRLGAELVVARKVACLEPGDPTAGTPHTIELDGGTRIRAKVVIVATGVEWRTLDVPGIERLLGRGVYHGASRTEARRFAGKRVHLVGGGNSCGQAAILFSDYAESVTMLVRGRTLAASMSQYLIDQLGAKHNIAIELESEVVGLEGADTLEAIEVARGPNRRRERLESQGLFGFIGARPETAWLPPSLIRDEWDYVCTGRDVMDLIRERVADSWPLERDPYLLETSVPGVLAVGDVRHGSVKRVSAAVGEGSMAIAVVHQYLTAGNSAGAVAAGRRA